MAGQTITPSKTQQVVNCANKYMNSNIIVNGIDTYKITQLRKNDIGIENFVIPAGFDNYDSVLIKTIPIKLDSKPYLFAVEGKSTDNNGIALGTWKNYDTNPLNSEYLSCQPSLLGKYKDADRKKYTLLFRVYPDRIEFRYRVYAESGIADKLTINVNYMFIVYG